MNMWDEFIESIPVRDDAVRNNDGRWVCPICGDPVTMNLTILGKERSVPVVCTCRKRGWMEEAKAKKLNEISQAIGRCFEGSPGLERCTFELDDQSDAKASKICRDYARAFGQMLTDGQGLLLMGRPGSGKSFLASAIANSIIWNDYTARVLNMATLANRLFAAPDKMSFVEHECQCHLLILDDFGAERNSAFALEATYQIINYRYNTMMPMVITTNLSGADFKNLPVEKQRVYDRILELCYPVIVNGTNRRMAIAMERRKRMEELFGGDNNG